MSIIRKIWNHDLFLQGNIRVWEYPLPAGFDTEDEMGTFYKLPSNEPFNLLVRVYVIRVDITCSCFYLRTQKSHKKICI